MGKLIVEIKVIEVQENKQGVNTGHEENTIKFSAETHEIAGKKLSAFINMLSIK